MNLEKSSYIWARRNSQLRMLQSTGSPEVEVKERLMASVKKEVKQLMEESVTKKCIHEESGTITKLCAAVEACLSQGLKRRALGLFKTSSTTALLHKIAKYCAEAEYISKLVQEIELSDPTKKFSWSSESFNRPIRLTSSAGSVIGSSWSNTYLASMKYLWIRLALYENRLVMIIEYLVQNAVVYYDKDSLLADRDYGCTLSSLLAGLSAVEFTRMKTVDPYCIELHADELVQRHRLSSTRRSSSVSSRPSIINFKRSLNTSTDDTTTTTTSLKSLAINNIAKDYIESLHQNVRATLLYGKNNVQVLPKDCKEPLMGYLSLHQYLQSLTIKWTPNQLIDGQQDREMMAESDMYWQYALNINMDDIVYVHCHQNKSELGDNGGTIVLVSHDGIQRPPIIFPEGEHMQQFLSCLESGLLPNGQLDPPLWTHRGFGKIFLWSKCVRKGILPSVRESFDDIPTDYVFRIVSKSKHEEYAAAYSILDFVRSTPKRAQLSSCSTTGSSDYSSKSISIDHCPVESPLTQTRHQSESIEMVCSTMRRQIISRAFYGWLAYCRHLSTVRTHLSGLVHTRITLERKSDEQGLTLENWKQLNAEDNVVYSADEVYRLVYYGGVMPDLRKHVWPYLLGHYRFGTTLKERQDQDESCRHYYETTMSEWLAVEAIVQQKEKEKTARAIAKLSSESTSGQDKTVKAVDIEPGDLENEVFEDISDTSEAADLERDDEKQKHCQEIITNAEHLMVKPLTRNMKTSTDSGHVDDVAEDVKFEEQIDREKNELSKKKYSNEEIIESSTSTSSFDTMGNAYQLLKNTTMHILLGDTDVDAISLLSPEYFSADESHEFFKNDGESEEVDNFGEYDGIAVNKKETVLITEASVDVVNVELGDSVEKKVIDDREVMDLKSACVSPASSIGGVYSKELLENFGLNLQRIEKDVQRCDRNFWYFANENLEKLRNVITTYVWEHLTVGYMQGMCDLVAPLLVILDDESLTYSCFCKLMDRMIENFPNGNAMDMHFINIRSLVQILDPEMYDLLSANGDQTHLYFCYRWFLLDFKRELVYDDVFATWEVIWASRHVASSHFVLFFALALLETYRDVILANSMDFTDVIKFFNEMAERHKAVDILQLARHLVLQLQIIIENK